jgi:hypothetical protein
VWLTLTQLLASGLGGYLAGRLRTRWAAVQSDEVFFRDTAHGFLAWAVASLVTAAMLTSAIGSILSGGVQAGASMVGGVASTASAAMSGAASAAGRAQASEGGVMGYWVDSLFRRDVSVAATSAADTNESSAARDSAEVSRIFMNITVKEPLPAEDLRYVGQLVAQRTGLPQADAEKRVAAVYAKAQAKLQNAQVAAQDAADKARKASAYSALWLFVSLLIGAFVASYAATFGGRLRDA